MVFGLDYGWCMSARTCLGLTLFWLAHGESLTALALFAGVSISTISKYLRWGMMSLNEVLESIPEASISCPSAGFLQDIGEQAGEIYGSVMKGCCIVTDGSLHDLEKDATAQANFFYDEYHPDYNGWKGRYCKKGLYFFALDGTIVWATIECLGSWADGLLFDRSSEFVRNLPEGCWILGDTAFAVWERVRKKNEHLPDDPDWAHWQLRLERFCRKSRISSEWGIKDLKNTWRIWKTRPLPSDDHDMRKWIWKSTMRLNNLRKRKMFVGQMSTVFVNDGYVI